MFVNEHFVCENEQSMRKKEATILIVDDDEDVLISAKMWLKRFFTHVLTTSSPKKINSFLRLHEIDVVLLDMNYRRGYEDGREGLYWLEYLKDVSEESSIVLMTGFGDINLAVESIKKGASDFILKPWNNEKLYASINSAVDISRKNRKINRLEKAQNPNPIEFIGESIEAVKALKLANKVAPTDVTVLILGENGTGKYVYAKEIHQRSGRSNKPFVHVDLGSLNENLFESELFGYKKGAFTDAIADTPGRFEQASGGTLFLDEIGNLSLPLQAKLLTVLQNRKVNRLGETKERSVDVRIICATNKSIHTLVKEGDFRQDLLFRINTIEVVLPPLREREDDIDLLASHFLNLFKKKYNKEKIFFSTSAILEMKNYSWPGNIRELENSIERAVILADKEEISEYDLQFSPIHVQTDFQSNLNLEEMENRLIKSALLKHKGNISQAAKELGLTRASLYRRIEKYKQ